MMECLFARRTYLAARGGALAAAVRDKFTAPAPAHTYLGIRGRVWPLSHRVGARVVNGHRVGDEGHQQPTNPSRANAREARGERVATSSADEVVRLEPGSGRAATYVNYVRPLLQLRENGSPGGGDVACVSCLMRCGWHVRRPASVFGCTNVYSVWVRLVKFNFEILEVQKCNKLNERSRTPGHKGETGEAAHHRRRAVVQLDRRAAFAPSPGQGIVSVVNTPRARRSLSACFRREQRE
ncbi:hypothetical protein EVAR_95204_1 [Eumeta japonica]|uniref:Uncharacterized protein n=1 Tax=Eumeta variegata TaxID=151549 RepID=A0A4C1VIG3_EUMVA|nr:hypothetical protein EVAR_95204_1 [Eumeta japonica]